MSEVSVAWTSIDSMEGARALARALVEEKRVACATILGPGLSIYSWEGQVNEAAEWVLMLKLPTAQVDALKQRLADLHPYEVPECVVVPVSDGHAPYLRWVMGA